MQEFLEKSYVVLSPIPRGEPAGATHESALGHVCPESTVPPLGHYLSST